MKRIFLIFMVCMISLGIFGKDVISSDYYLVELKEKGLGEIESLRNINGVMSVTDFGDCMLVKMNSSLGFHLEKRGFDSEKLVLQPEWKELSVALNRGKPSPIDSVKDQIKIYRESDKYIIFQASSGIMEFLHQKQNNHFMVETVKEGEIYFIPTERFLYKKKSKKTNNQGSLLPDQKRFSNRVEKLENYVTRYSYSEQYKSSAEWCVSEFQKMGYESSLLSYNQYGKEQWNVVACKPGHEKESGVYLVVGHLDATSNQASVNAPGADDNASGSAGAMEIATLFSNHPKASKLRFLLFAGEELGLKGSTAYVASLSEEEKKKIAGVVNLDMISFDAQPPLSCMFQSDRLYENWIMHFVKYAEEQGLKSMVSLRAWGSDHVPFVRKGVPAFLLIEDEYASNPHYHQITDLHKNMNPALSMKILTVIAQGIEELLR